MIPPEVFISYSQSDKSSADALCKHLENAAIRCWIAPRDVPPGAEWPEAITAAIVAAKLFVVLFTANTEGSRHVRAEVRTAFESEKILVPIRLAPVKPLRGLAHLLGDSQWIDAFPEGLDLRCADIVAKVKHILGPTGRTISEAMATRGVERIDRYQYTLLKTIASHDRYRVLWCDSPPSTLEGELERDALNEFVNRGLATRTQGWSKGTLDSCVVEYFYTISPAGRELLKHANSAA